MPQFQPPNFDARRQFPDIGRGLEEFMNAYIQAKKLGIQEQQAGQQQQVFQDQRIRQDLADTGTYGQPIRNFTPQQMQSASVMAQPGFANPSAQMPGNVQSGIQEDTLGPLRGLVENFVSQRQNKNLGTREKMADVRLTETKGDLNQELIDASKRGQPSGPVIINQGGRDFLVERDRYGRESLRPLAEASGVKTQLSTENTLRDELSKQSGDFIKVRDSYGKIVSSANKPSAAGDLALIFNYMKILDPGSTVREGEFANAQNAGGVPDKVVALYNNIKKGERLSEGQRSDFVSRADDLYKAQERIQSKQEEQFRGLATRSGARPENVVINRNLDLPSISTNTTQGSALTPEQAARLALLRAKRVSGTLGK